MAQSVDRKESPPCTAKTEEALKSKGYTLQEKLGYGSFSRVYKSKCNDKESACKVIDLEKTSNDYRNKFLPRELYTLRRLRHPNIIFIYDILTFGSRIYIFMDLADGGDILDHLKANGPIPEPKAKEWFKQTCDALKYVHSYGIAHRDLKSENILLDRAGYAKLTDFGFSRMCYEQRTGRRVLSETYCGSAAYVAPEVLKAVPYNPMLADCWSMGVVLYVMVNNALPFEDSDLNKMLTCQLSRRWSYNLKVEKGLSAAVKDLINILLDPNVTVRLSTSKVLRHQWLSDAINTTPKLPDLPGPSPAT
jgi:serine kinase